MLELREFEFKQFTADSAVIVAPQRAFRQILANARAHALPSLSPSLSSSLPPSLLPTGHPLSLSQTPFHSSHFVYSCSIAHTSRLNAKIASYGLLSLLRLRPADSAAPPERRSSATYSASGGGAGGGAAVAGSDVWGFGMIMYECLTRRIPGETHRTRVRI